jgi:hypothetical protein
MGMNNGSIEIRPSLVDRSVIYGFFMVGCCVGSIELFASNSNIVD